MANTNNHKRASKRAQKRRGTQFPLPFDEYADIRNVPYYFTQPLPQRKKQS